MKKFSFISVFFAVLTCIHQESVASQIHEILSPTSMLENPQYSLINSQRGVSGWNLFGEIYSNDFATQRGLNEQKFREKVSNLTPFTQESISCCCHKHCDLGQAFFSTHSNDEWYEIFTLPYPETVLLSKDRNGGSTQGAVRLTPTGLQAQLSGTYWATFSAIVQNNNPEYAPLIVAFLLRDGVFNPFDTSILSGLAALPYQQVTNIQATGLLQHVEPGTTFSIVVTNGGSPEPEPITVISWSIQILKVCDD